MLIPLNIDSSLHPLFKGQGTILFCIMAFVWYYVSCIMSCESFPYGFFCFLCFAFISRCTMHGIKRVLAFCTEFYPFQNGPIRLSLHVTSRLYFYSSIAHRLPPSFSITQHHVSRKATRTRLPKVRGCQYPLGNLRPQAPLPKSHFHLNFHPLRNTSSAANTNTPNTFSAQRPAPTPKRAPAQRQQQETATTLGAPKKGRRSAHPATIRLSRPVSKTAHTLERLYPRPPPPTPPPFHFRQYRFRHHLPRRHRTAPRQRGVCRRKNVGREVLLSVSGRHRGHLRA